METTLKNIKTGEQIMEYNGMVITDAVEGMVNGLPELISYTTIPMTMDEVMAELTSNKIQYTIDTYLSGDRAVTITAALTAAPKNIEINVSEQRKPSPANAITTAQFEYIKKLEKIKIEGNINQIIKKLTKKQASYAIDIAKNGGIITIIG